MRMGTNFNTLQNHTDLPNGYILKTKENLEEGLKIIKALRTVASMDFIRTFIWLSEHSSNETPWLHIPLTDDEINLIQRYVFNSYPTTIELVWGPQWDARSFCPFLRPNKFANLDELIEAHIDSFTRLLFKGAFPLSNLPNVVFDFWNEKDPRDKQDDIFNVLYSKFQQILFKRKQYTVSLMIEPDGNYDYAQAQYRIIQSLSPSYTPDFVELHWNTSDDNTIYKKCEKVISKMKNEKRIYFGEIDCELSPDTLQKIYRAMRGQTPTFPLIAWWQRTEALPNF